uniref:Uncharacterized protein n=1 Tax=Brassica campestris TaxID=3711 RepID=M4CNR8_BRACM
MAYDIMNIRRMVVRSKALETSTNCFIRMQGNTIAAMGSFTVSDDSGLLLKHASILEIVLWMS